MESAFDTGIAKAFKPKNLILSCKGLSCVNWDCCDADFEFVVVGHDKVCRVHSVLAEFLSPKVARVRKCDPLCYVYRFKDSQLFDVFEGLVSTVRSGGSLRVEKSTFTKLVRLAQELENSTLLSSLLRMIKPESLTLEEALLLLGTGIDLGTAFSSRFGNLSDFIASHFYELSDAILDDLDFETTQILLSSPSLKIRDEDSLYDFVRYRSEKDLKFTSLFEFVYFEYLSVSRIENFTFFMRENFLEKISVGLWTRICGRLMLGTELQKNPRVIVPHGNKFVYDSSKPLEGVIAYLTRECGGNVHDKGIVNVTASSFYGSFHPKNAAYLGTGSRYVSNGEWDAWICYDFKERRVIPTSYTLRSCIDGPKGAHLKSWVIEVSNDRSSWIEIDRRDNNNDLNGSYAIANFKISKVLSEGFRFFRLKQNGKNHSGNLCYIDITSLEIFGNLCNK